MEDYPGNLKEFDLRFRSEEGCRAYLLQLRWPDGFCCPRCRCRESSLVRTILLRCAACRHQTSVTAGTIFQDTRTPLRVWFQAMWWVTTQKNGASALGLQRVLGLQRYETAWTMQSSPIKKPRKALLPTRATSCKRRACYGLRDYSRR
jgi:Transposase zinc-ribbon domain